MTLTVRSLGSGSSGNALLLDTGTAAIAVDCGVGPRALRMGLLAAGRSVSELDAVLLTHEHADHVRSLRDVVKAGVTVVATAGTARASGLSPKHWQEGRVGTALRVGGFEVTPIPVSHDAQAPCGYHIATPFGRVTVLTDLGRADEALHDYVDDADLIVLEANHDEHLLRHGPYPAQLKRRVLSDRGHLSNAECGAMLVRALKRTSESRSIWLAHLSSVNNRPRLATVAVQQGLAGCAAGHRVIAMPRHGHELVWSSRAAPSDPIQLALPLT